MKVYLLRHGQTEWNVMKKWQGNTDIELNSMGISQAENVAKRFENRKVSKIYASNLSRAKKTAEVIREKAFNNEVEFFIENDLAEIKLGEWEGLTYEDVSTKFEEHYKKWSTSEDVEVGFGVENYYQLQQRAFNIFTKICSENSEDILIVSHGAWIKALVCKILNLPLEHKNKFEIGNTSITTIEVTEKGFFIKTLNDTDHID